MIPSRRREEIQNRAWSIENLTQIKPVAGYRVALRTYSSAGCASSVPALVVFLGNELIFAISFWPLARGEPGQHRNHHRGPPSLSGAKREGFSGRKMSIYLCQLHAKQRCFEQSWVGDLNCPLPRGTRNLRTLTQSLWPDNWGMLWPIRAPYQLRSGFAIRFSCRRKNSHNSISAMISCS